VVGMSIDAIVDTSILETVAAWSAATEVER
jgi:hypothetical protein